MKELFNLNLVIAIMEARFAVFIATMGSAGLHWSVFVVGFCLLF